MNSLLERRTGGKPRCPGRRYDDLGAAPWINPTPDAPLPNFECAEPGKNDPAALTYLLGNGPERLVDHPGDGSIGKLRLGRDLTNQLVLVHASSLSHLDGCLSEHGGFWVRLRDQSNGQNRRKNLSIPGGRSKLLAHRRLSVSASEGQTQWDQDDDRQDGEVSETELADEGAVCAR